ncbi:MAG: hypothetical protein LBQ05_02420 [Christensenellaceae bacterium]|jgi:hypothetical protein|nr:hypothetical protein [Christensenellaceae bacterium]
MAKMIGICPPHKKCSLGIDTEKGLKAGQSQGLEGLIAIRQNLIDEQKYWQEVGHSEFLAKNDLIHC